MKKVLFFTLILSVLFLSCSKDKEVTPSASLEGKYNLKSIYSKITYNFDNDVDENTLEPKSGSFTFSSNNKLETTLAVGNLMSEEIIEIIPSYSSEYTISGNELTLHLKDLNTGKFVPLKVKISKNEGIELELSATKEEISNALKAADENIATLFNLSVKTLDIKMSLIK